MNKKIRTFKQVCQITRRLKKQGKKIVFCHGFFDILHRGHVTLLVEAKKLGDVLVVGVDHDNNAKILKGADRPINDHDSRIFLLANLEPVDYIFLISAFGKSRNKDEIYTFFKQIYLDLRPNIVATCIKAGEHGVFKKKRAEECKLKFVDINHGIYGKNTTGIIKLLEGKEL